MNRSTGGGPLPTRIALSVLAALAALALLAGAWAVLDSDRAAPGSASEHGAPIPETARTVTISAAMPLPSAHARRLSAMLEEGAMPDAPTMAEVLTDSECTPDASMVSHCRNEMLLSDGRRLVLRHAHDMSRVPCLAPGEQVLVVPASV
jgi:hypothetical protein